MRYIYLRLGDFWVVSSGKHFVELQASKERGGQSDICTSSKRSIMASVHVQNLKRGRDEFWHGGLVLPEAKRSNSGHDTDLMALLERIENIDDINYQHNNNNNNNITAIVSSEFEDEEDERLNVVMKSLEDEIGLTPKEDNNVQNGANGNVNAGEDHKEEGTAVADDNKNPDDNNTAFVDANSEATTSVSDVGDLYYDDIRAEFGFFADQTEEMGIMANIYNSDALHAGYVDNTTEVFYGLWEDDIWQLNVNEHAAAFVQKAEEVGDAGGELNDVGNDIRPIQCLSAGEEGS